MFAKNDASVVIARDELEALTRVAKAALNLERVKWVDFSKRMDAQDALMKALVAIPAELRERLLNDA